MEISFGDEKHGQQIWVICLLCDLPPNFSPKKILYGLFLDRRLRVQNLMKNLSSFLPTGLKKPRIKSRVSHKFPSPANRHTQFGPGEARFTRDRPGRSYRPCGSRCAQRVAFSPAESLFEPRREICAEDTPRDAREPNRVPAGCCAPLWP